MQSSNKVMLIVAGLFAALGLLAMVFMAYFQWRTINRLAEISAALPVAHALGAGPPVAALGAGDAHLVTVGPPEQSSQRLLGALERLEKRIDQLGAHRPIRPCPKAPHRPRKRRPQLPRPTASDSGGRSAAPMPHASPCCWAKVNPC